MRRNAFTLFELLLAMAVTVIIAAILAESLFVAYRARAAAMRSVEATRQTDLTADVIASDLANCPPPTGVLRGVFEGAQNSIDFYTTGPEPKAVVQGDIREVVYALAPDTANPGQQMLVRQVRTNLLAQDVSFAPDEPICHNVNSITWSYFDGTNWNDSWDSTQNSNALPLAVEFTIEIASPHPGDAPLRTTRIIPMTCAPTSQPASLFGGSL